MKSLPTIVWVIKPYKHDRASERTWELVECTKFIQDDDGPNYYYGRSLRDGGIRKGNRMTDVFGPYKTEEEGYQKVFFANQWEINRKKRIMELEDQMDQEFEDFIFKKSRNRR